MGTTKTISGIFFRIHEKIDKNFMIKSPVLKYEDGEEFELSKFVAFGVSKTDFKNDKVRIPESVIDTAIDKNIRYIFLFDKKTEERIESFTVDYIDHGESDDGKVYLPLDYLLIKKDTEIEYLKKWCKNENY